MSHMGGREAIEEGDRNPELEKTNMLGKVCLEKGGGGYVSEWFGKVSSLMKPHGFSPNKFLLYAWGF